MSILKLVQNGSKLVKPFSIARTTRSLSKTVSINNEIQLEYLENDKKGIVVLGLNKIKTSNAFSRSFVSDLTTVVNELANDNTIRVTIIRSLVPKIFCAGADLKERFTQTPNEITSFVASLKQLLINISQLPMPVIAAMDGAALGGGLELALACDILIASKNAKLGLVETKWAIIPGAGGIQRLSRTLNTSKAKELIFTAKILNGTEAESLGFVNYAVEQNDTKDAAYMKAIDIALQILPNGPIGVRLAKKAIDKGSETDINTGFAIDEACYAQTLPTSDRLEGLKAFMEKRKPNYTGE